MMAGLYAALAAQALAETEAQLQAEEAARQAAAQRALLDQLRSQEGTQMAGYAAQRENQPGIVIDVQAREVPEPLALPAPTNNAPPIRDQVGNTERDTQQ